MECGWRGEASSGETYEKSDCDRGAGFIGSNLAEELANMGYEVVILDNLSTGNINNLSNLLKKKTC